MEYLRCASKAQQRNGQRRDASLATVAMGDGRWLSFSKEARKAIPAEVIDYIRWVVATSASDFILRNQGSITQGFWPFPNPSLPF